MNRVLSTLTIFLLMSSFRTADIDSDSFTSNEDTYCDGTGWVSYRDEKCFKLITKWATRDEAKDICAQDSSQLISIKTGDEQKYLTEFVFKESQVSFNIWIGAKRLLENTSKFVWDDGSDMADFSNWDQTYPTEDERRGCVVMQSGLIKNADKTSGKWCDTICNSVNYVVCQKLPKWSFAKLQQELLNTRKELKDSNIQLAQELKDSNFKLTQELVDTKSELSQTKNRLTNVESNPVPIGFIYVQLSSQPEPKALWSAVQWNDVTSEYAGLFFRAEGGDAAQFGTVQTENAPRLTQVRLVGDMDNQGDAWWQTNLNVGGWSTGIGVFAGSWNGQKGHTHQFLQSGGEVRPKNMAIRIWRRTN